MARTRPDAPKLLPQEYGRANYLRREIQLALDCAHLNPDGEGAAALAAFFAAVGEIEVVPAPAPEPDPDPTP